MKKIVYIGPNQYSNLKSDLITHNKIDAVSFDFTHVEKGTENFAKEMKLYKFKGDSLELDEGNLILAYSDIKEWDSTKYTAEQTYWDIKDEFENKHFCRFDEVSKTVYFAMLLESKNSFIYDSLLNIVIMENYVDRELDPNYQKVNISARIGSSNLLTSTPIHILNEPVMTVLKDPNLSYKFHLLNEKQAFFYCKFQVQPTQNADTYTKSIEISVTADTWSTSKMTMYYALDGDEVKPFVQNPDGTFKGLQNADGTFKEVTTQNIFEYPSNELIRYETQVDEIVTGSTQKEFLHRQIAKEILTDFQHGRSSVEFELPHAKLGFIDSYGENIPKPDLPNAPHICPLEIELGDAVMLGDERMLNEEFVDSKQRAFIGGFYKQSMKRNISGSVRDVKIPKQYEVTGIEYNYDGGMLYAVKAMEKPFRTAANMAFKNGIFTIILA